MPNENINKAKARLRDDEKALLSKTSNAVNVQLQLPHATPNVQQPGATELYTNTSPSKATRSGGARTTGRIDNSPAETGNLSHAIPLNASPYYFDGTMSEELLHKYLDKTLEVSRLSYFYWFGNPVPDDGEGGPIYREGYDPLNTTNPKVDYLFDPHYDHRKLLDMIINTGAKFVFNATWIHTNNQAPWNDFEWVLKTLEHDCKWIHDKDPDIIVGASIGEFAEVGPWNIRIPTDLINIFYPSGRTGLTNSFGQTIDAHNFDPNFMYINRIATEDEDGIFRIHAPDGWNLNSHMDISSPETRMWYYYLAKRYIDAGCESIHFGDLFSGCCNGDDGNAVLWQLIQQIRTYGRTYARRHLVLLDTHCSPDFDNLADNKLEHYLYGWYFDPIPSNPLPDFERQLIFDFNSLGTYYIRNNRGDCNDGPPVNITAPVYNLADENSVLPVILKWGHGLLNHNKGGLSPLGWHCSHIPNLVHYDRGMGTVSPGAGGCYTAVPIDKYNNFDSYQYDNTSWFIRQTPAERQRILIYTYYKIRCLDPYSHFAMPARYFYIKKYNINLTSSFNFFNSPTVVREENTIKNIWNNNYPSPSGWAPSNFTLDNVANRSTHVAMSPAAALTVHANNKMFFIGADGYIRGYVFNNGTYNGGVWLEVDLAQISNSLYGTPFAGAGSQVKAANSLVVSPDGSTLLYIGVDGYIYRYIIHSPFNYQYTTFMKEDMQAQNIIAVGSLIYPTDNAIYYIASYPSPLHQNRIHGFQKSLGTWHTVSPTYSAIAYGQPIETQPKADGYLTYCRLDGHSRIYYRYGNGYIAYYEIHDLVTYSCHISPVTSELQSRDLIAFGNTCIVSQANELDMYFVGQTADNIFRIYRYRESSLTHSIVDLAYSASFTGTPISNQKEPYSDGTLAVSPNGKYIVYLAASHLAITHFPAIRFLLQNNALPWLCCYTTNDGAIYEYSEFKHQQEEAEQWTSLGNFIQFKDESEFYLISHNALTSSINIGEIKRFKLGECFCNNPIIDDYENS